MSSLTEKSSRLNPYGGEVCPTLSRFSLGATWHPLTINPMLALRIIRANDWWSEFWSKYKPQADLNLVNNHLESKLDLAL